MLCALLAIPFVQANNVAVPGSQLLDIPSRGKPGLMTQLSRLPTGSKVGALLTIWLFPDLTVPAPPSTWTLYTTGVDTAYSKGFRMVLMPNLPDISKTEYYRTHYTRMQNQAFHNMFASFNVQYASMIEGFKRRHPDVKFATFDVFTNWDGTGTVPDGLHPNTDTHRLFAGWFYIVVRNF